MIKKSLQAAFDCESRVADIISRQTIKGVVFNVQRAKFYVYALEEKKVKLFALIRPLLTLEVTQPYTIPINKPFKKDGTYTAGVLRWFSGGEEGQVGGAFSRISFDEPSLGSRQKLTKQLLRLGWKPTSFTEKGSPKLTVQGSPCVSLLSIGSEVGQRIADWYIYSHRQSQIKGWLKKVRPDGRLSAEAFTIGTPTYRFRHKTVVNVPKAAKDYDEDIKTWFWPKGKPSTSVPFGRQMRSLFTVPKGMVMVGHDASGLELRMLAHYMNDAKFTKELLDGDIHTANQIAAGLPSRDAAKTFIYAFNYGAGVVKLGAIVGGGGKEGAKIKKKFLKANPKLEKLITRVTTASERGYLTGLDGRKVRMRRDPDTKEIQTHKALNTLLQCAGAIVMKYSMIYLNKWVESARLRAYKVIDMHDEAQWEVHPDDVEKYMELAVKSIVKAGEHLELNCPLDADASVGRNWSATH